MTGVLFAVLLIVLQGNWLYGAQGPTITRQPSNTYAVKSGIAELICEATGKLPLKYKWYHDGDQVLTSERRRILSNGHLYIKRVLHKKRRGISDTGQYYCTVTDVDGQTAKSKTVNISMGHIRKEFREDPTSQTVSRGGELVLTCTPPRGKPRPQVRWLKDGRNLDIDNTRILLEARTNKLTVKNFAKEDEGSYKCEATNVAGRRLSKVAVITSTVAPKIISLTKDKIVNLNIHSQTILTCKAQGVPAPKIIWTKEGNDTVLPSSGGTLTLTNLEPRDIGKYKCTAFNSEGNVTKSVHLLLHYVPEFTVLSPDANAVEGTTLRLKCLAKSEPYPLIFWRKGENVFAVGQQYGHISVERKGETVDLIFKPLKLSDANNYTCEATNKIGSNTRDVNVAVYKKSEYAPSIVTAQMKVSADINSNVTIICDVDGNPKPTVRWSKIGQDDGLGDGVITKAEKIGKKHRYSLIVRKVQKSDEGTYQCMAINKIQTVTKDIVLRVSRRLRLSRPISAGGPSMPKNVKAREYNDNSARITWDHSDDPVLLYAVGFINVDLRSNEKYAADDISPNADQYVVPGLQPNTRYMFFVRGINAKGSGVPSLLSNVIRTKSAGPTSPALTTPSVELPKLKIKLSPGGAGELRVVWQKLNDNIDIDGFYIYWRVKGSRYITKEILQNHLSTGYTISELQNSTKYSVEVEMFKGTTVVGLKSKTVNQRTSRKPVSLKIGVTRNDSDSISVTWKRLWKPKSGKDSVKSYTIFCNLINNEKRRRKRNEDDLEIQIPTSPELKSYIVGDLTPGKSYSVRMSVTTALGRSYSSQEESIVLRAPIVNSQKSTLEKIKDFVIQPWFLGVLGGVLFLLILVLLLCCVCRRSSNKKDVDNVPIELQNTEAVRKAPSEGQSTESAALTPGSRTGRESSSECGAESYDGRSGSVYRCTDSPRTPTRSNLDFPNIAITPNKYERMYRSLEARESDSASYGSRPTKKYSESDFDSPSRFVHRTRNPYSPAPRPSCLNVDNCSDYDNAKPKCESTPKSAKPRTPETRSPYPGEAPPDYETAIAENSKDSDDQKGKKESRDNYRDLRDSHVPSKNDRYGNPSSRQSSCSPGSECSNQGSSVAGRRKGLKPLPRLTIASVNWADMLPPPPSHPPPSSVATRSPPPSPTATSMCSETTYGRSHASSFHPRRSGSVVSADVASDLERADSVRSGKSKGKSENKLPFDLAGITSDIIMQWADSVTNTSGSEDDESPCSSPDRRSGISSDGSFLTDTDFANAVKAAAECGGFNIDIDLNMYKAMDPISFQPFAGSLSTYNPESSSSIKPPSKKTASKDGDSLRDSSRSRRARSENSRDSNLAPVKEHSDYVPAMTETKNSGKSKNANVTVNNGSTGYVPALTRTSALGKLEPVKKKYAVVRTLPQSDNTPDYPSHSLSSSTSNASTIRSSSCPPVMLSDEDTEDDVI